MCPHCRQNAPLVFQGMTARCVACGAIRAPWSAGSVTYAGKPSRVGGQVARVLGWAVLASGLVLATVLGLLAAALWPGSPAPWIAFTIVGLLTVRVGVPRVFGGKQLDTSGEQTEVGTRMQALFALAANRSGALRAHEAAAALGLSIDETDALLTRMAKERPDDVTLDVTDAGEIVYGFPAVLGAGAQPRWAAGGAPGDRVRFETPPTSTGARVAPPSGPVRVLDAEFEEIEEPSSPARARARA